MVSDPTRVACVCAQAWPFDGGIIGSSHPSKSIHQINIFHIYVCVGRDRSWFVLVVGGRLSEGGSI